MSAICPVAAVIQSQPTIEGAGVHLRRGFGYAQLPQFDPFLLFDDFSGNDAALFSAGFPWHPHRGIETITYMLEGEVEHRDSLGHQGRIGPGDVQWMTAGSGIIHQEMPRGERICGFQLWANLPQKLKMTAPLYRDIRAADIPVIEMSNGVTLHIISGRIFDVHGAVQGIAIQPLYLDVTVPADSWLELPVDEDLNIFSYILQGHAVFGPCPDCPGIEVDSRWYRGISAGHIVHLGSGTMVSISPRNDTLRLLIIAGKALNEPVAWRGPIVMNTEEQLHAAFEAYRMGTFLDSSEKSA